MSEAWVEREAEAIVAETIAYWQSVAVTPEVALRAMELWPRRDTWAEARNYMVRWWLRHRDAA